MLPAILIAIAAFFAGAVSRAGAVLTRSGEKGDPGLLYLHLEPAASMVAAGFWHPEPPILLRLRRAIVSDPDRFIQITEALDAAGLGDLACWYNASHNELQVLKGSALVIVQLRGRSPDALTTVAKQALGRLK